MDKKLGVTGNGHSGMTVPTTSDIGGLADDIRWVWIVRSKTNNQRFRRGIILNDADSRNLILDEA